MSTENTQNTTPVSGASIESAPANTGTESITAAASTPPPMIEKSIGEKIADIKAAKDASAQGAAPVVPAGYTPNYKYKAAMQEKELDPFWHALIKDQDSEKKVKEVFTKVEAFDYLKNKHEGITQNFQTLKEDYDSQSALVTKVTGAIQKGDLDSAFRNIGLTDDQIIRWAAKRVDYLQMMNQLPPEQKAAIEQHQQAAYQNQEYQDQLQHMQSQVEAQATQARGLQLDMIMSRPEINQAASFWDSKMGQVGAFRDLVIEEGQKAFAFEQQDLSAEQAAQRVLAKFGRFIDAQGNVASQAQVPTQAQVIQPSPAGGQKPIIPAINGTSKTPIKKQFKSIDDIKKYNQERENAVS